MKYLFSALYVIGTVIVLLNAYLLVVTGWAWAPVIKIIIALLFLYFNYRFMKEAYKARNQRSQQKKQK